MDKQPGPKPSQGSQFSSTIWRCVLLEGFVVGLLINSFFAWKEAPSVERLQISAEEPISRGQSRVLDAGGRELPGVYRQGIYAFGNKKLILCKIEKVASRVVLQLGARVDGVDAWHSNELGDIQAYALTKRATSTKSLTGGSIPKVAMVRDPATRLLSAYISKLEAPDWPFASSYAPNCPNKTTSFEQFVEVLEGNSDMMQVNRHFRPQHLFCGFEHGVEYDCVIKYEDRIAGWKNCLAKLGLWEEFGATGWGPNSTQAIFEEHENYLNVDVPKVFTVTLFPTLFQKYYTLELLQRVVKIFKEDYRIFGYEMPM